MLAPTTADTVAVDIGNGTTVEYTNELLEALRRLAVTGLAAFGRGGLEIGGVLYGLRDGGRMTIHGFAEFASEHARGPGFLLSQKDREGFAHLVEAPAGLETIGWYRAHTRADLHLDAGDRELFDALPVSGSVIGLVLKPSHWGPSAGAFYLREPNGAVLPDAPREFAITPPERPKQESPAAETPPVINDEPAADAGSQPKETLPPEAPPRLKTQHLPPVFSPQEKRLAGAVGAALALMAVIGLSLFIRSRHPRELSLQAYAVAPGQLRISWNRNSRPVMEGISGMVEINDGGYNTQIPLSAGQLKINGITYTQKTDHVSINLRVDGRRTYAPPAQESIEFVGPVQAGATVAEASPEAEALARELRAELPIARTVHGPRDELPVETTVKPSTPVRPFKLPTPHNGAAAPAVALPAAPPPAAVTSATQAALPEVLAKATVIPRPTVTQPVAAPRTGRLIWTGN